MKIDLPIASESKATDFGNQDPHIQQIDTAVLADWKSMTGAGYRAFLFRMVQQFVQDAGHCIPEIQQAVERQDIVTLTKAAHGLKGVSGNMRARHMAELSLELAPRGRNQAKDDIEPRNGS